ncbi:MAG: peptide ABC transporter substrate-binding protein, partial [Steroidobacteraceae bacterium]|nr:peptide ABC transporter substrate-binding protein [Steroidobacteraceae bacterium]MDW8260823.1 peptide ABC transporter substrate-binding protein [Gammaproteobacteria bacterium]
KWSDGTPLRAADFVYSFQRLMLPETAARYASFLYVIRNARAVNTGKAPVSTLGVDAPDPQTLRIELEHPAAHLTELLTSVGSVAVPRHAIERHGREWTRPEHFVSNGAYQLVAVQPQTYIRVRKNPHFHAASSVAFDEVVYYPVEDDGTSFKRFQIGELAVAVRFPADRIDRIRRDFGAQLRSAPGLGTTMLMLNHRRKPFDDARVRRALSLAIERQVLTERILRRTAVPAFTVVPGSVSRYPQPPIDDSRRPLPDRQAEARRLLSAAGYDSRKPLRFTMLYYTESKTRALAVAMAAMWRSIGVECELLAQDLGSVISAVRAGNYQVSLYAWFSSFDDPSTFLDLLATKARGSLSGYSNSAFDAAFAAANALADPVQRYAALARAEALAMADQPVIPLFNNVNQRLVSNRIEGWIDNPRGANLSRYLRARG